MFTTIDKALVGVIMGALYLLNNLAGINFGIGEDTVTAIVAAATPILVWLVPNAES